MPKYIKAFYDFEDRETICYSYEKYPVYFLKKAIWIPRHQTKKSGAQAPDLKSDFYKNYQPSNHANISGATMVASLSTINLGVCISSLPQVIFSLGTAPL